MPDENPYPHLVRREEIEAASNTFSHPWNVDSEISGTHLSGLGGLSRSGVSVVRIAPGKESFAYHLHHREEEWIYLLAGRGVARIDGRDYRMNAGDFVAFPTPSVAHNMSNPFDEDLVYLMGGESLDCEIADFPELDKRMIRMGKNLAIYNLSDTRDFGDEE